MLVYGCGRRAQLSGLLQERGCRSAWILTGRSSARAAGELAGAMEAKGLQVHLTAGIPAEPTVEDFHSICGERPKTEIDTVIGIGGGSVLDVAKLIAALAEFPERLASAMGTGLLPSRKRTLVCLPTTAGSGSEASPNAILLDREEGTKKAVISPHLVPDIALVDPELARTLPSDLTATTAFDALCHCIEAYTNNHAHAVVDAWALQGISLISRHLVQAVHDGNDLSARSALALGSFLGGLCLGPVNTAAVHALSYPLGSRFGLAHGLANALLLPHVMRFNLPASPARYAAVAAAMGVGEKASETETAEAGIRHLAGLAEACSWEDRLRTHGISETDIPGLARQALEVTRLLKNNPRALAYEDAVAIYTEVF